MSAIDFHEIHSSPLDMDLLAKRYDEFASAIETAETHETRLMAIENWDRLRREIGTWQEMTELRFHQDTTNERYKIAREQLDQLRPRLTEWDNRIKRQLVESDDRAALEQEFGAQAFALWQSDVSTYDPVIEESVVAESKLEADYVELTAAAKFQYDGRTYNLSEFGKFREDPDRAIRHATEKVRWKWFADHRNALDSIYDAQVKLRHEMALQLGFADFIEMGYRRMNRIDYSRDDVERFRNAVREHVTPFGAELRQRQADALNIDQLMYWDEGLLFPEGNPAPQGDHDWMIQRAIEMFDAMSGSLGQFFRMMVDCHLMDLKSRDGKAGGGFCTSFASYGVPYIFANFNGTKGDVEVFTHEMGHAYQCYESRNQRLTDYLWPTYESCEIHSMSLEFLTWPYMEKFFGDAAEQFRQAHLTQALLFLPYGVTVDHFQHLVYANPEATPAERFEMWRDLERIYMPWRDYGDVPHASDGGMWQLQRHIYLCPFYYIDYTLAQTCALQFWVRSREDYGTAMKDYEALCRRGGEAPFQQLAESAALISPFTDGCLNRAVRHAREALTV